MYNQTSIKQGDIPAQLNQLVLERGSEDTNPVSGVCPASGDYPQGIFYEVDSNEHCDKEYRVSSPFVGRASQIIS